MVGSPPPPDKQVGLHNWQLSPFNRWSFQHTREVIPSANVGRGSGTSSALGPAPAPVGEVEFESSMGERMTIADFLDQSWTDGFLVLHGGRIAFEAYRNGMREDTRHLAMSVSKSITSLVVGILAGRGLIDVDALVTRYVPELAGTAFEGATIQHLLDMEVANAWHEDYFSDATEYWRLDVACGWLPPREDAPASLFEFLKQTSRDGRHGERIQYSSPNPDLLGLIAERVAGAPFAEVVSRELWAPMGAEFDADLTVDPVGMAVADGGFCLALRDFGRVGQLFLNGGSVGTRQVVPRAWIEECRRPNPKPFHPTSYGADLPGASYHNQWWAIDGRSFALGIHGQMIAIDQQAGVVVVFNSSPPEPNATAQRLTQRRIVSAVSPALG
jgi:CubicO group peptidase (beta-lactamase class C family)